MDTPSLFASEPKQPNTRRTVAEFFAGIGLARIGFEAAGWRVVFANDIDEQKRIMHEGHFGPERHYHVCDIREFVDHPARVPEVALAHASFPCTDLSVAGARRGLRSGESSAFWPFIDVLAKKREEGALPSLVLLENVVGFLSSHKGEDFREALLALNGLGFFVDAFVIDAAHFVPQSRPRLFVVGLRERNEDEVLAKDLRPSPLRPKALLDAINALADVRWSLRPLPDLPPYGSVRLADIIERVPLTDPQWWSRERAEYLFSQMSDRHSEIAKQMMAKKKWTFGTVFRRVRNGRSMAELRTDGLAGCLRTPKGGSGRQILFQAGYGRYHVRLLNPRECARLMGADGFRVEVPLNQALFGFGDAVCVPVIKWIAENYFNSLISDDGHVPAGATRGA